MNKGKIEAKSVRDDMLISTYLKLEGITEKYTVTALCFKYRGIIKTKKEWFDELKKDQIKLGV